MSRKTKFTDRDMLNDLLWSIKNLSSQFNTYHSEASCEETVEVIEDLLLTAQDEQRETFDFMNKKGWYPLESEDKSKISESVTKFTDSRSELPELDI